MLSGVRTAYDRQLACFFVVFLVVVCWLFLCCWVVDCCLQLGTFLQSVFVEVFRKEQWEQLWLQSHLCQ